MSYSATIENALKYSATIEAANIPGIQAPKYSGTIELLDSADIDFNLCDHLGNVITDQSKNVIVCLTEKIKLLYSAVIEILRR